MHEKCEACRYSCKNEQSCKKFYPKEALLGYPVHFKEDSTKHYGNHEATSRMCVVCKNYFHYDKIRWIKLSRGLYPFCPECGSRNDYIVQNVALVSE